MDFGDAITAAKSGVRVARRDWNGKGMWVTRPGTLDIPTDKSWAVQSRLYAEQNWGTATVLPCLTMKTESGKILTEWLASQTDMEADDWEIVS